MFWKARDGSVVIMIVCFGKHEAGLLNLGYDNIGSVSKHNDTALLNLGYCGTTGSVFTARQGILNLVYCNTIGSVFRPYDKVRSI